MENLDRIGAKRYKIWKVIEGEKIDTGKTIVATSREYAKKKLGVIIFPFPWIGVKYTVSEVKQ